LEQIEKLENNYKQIDDYNAQISNLQIESSKLISDGNNKINEGNKMKNKNVLVTGGSGFIASHLVKQLLSLGAKVTITTRYNSVIDNIRLEDVWENINVIECDLRDPDSLQDIKKRNPDALVAIEIPLLYEADMVYLVDKVIVVSADRNVQIARALQDGYLREDTLKRIESQLELSKKGGMWRFCYR